MNAHIQSASPTPTMQSPKIVDSSTFFASSKALRQMTEPPNTKIEPTMNIMMLSTIMDGYSKAMEISTLFDRVSADEAAAFGLVHRTVPAPSLIEDVTAAAERLAALPARASLFGDDLTNRHARNSGQPFDSAS